MKNKFEMVMQTIDLEDTLTLIISKADRENFKIKGEISIKIYDLYYHRKKKYMLGDDTYISLKVKYVESAAEVESIESENEI